MLRFGFDTLKSNNIREIFGSALMPFVQRNCSIICVFVFCQQAQPLPAQLSGVRSALEARIQQAEVELDSANRRLEAQASHMAGLEAKILEREQQIADLKARPEHLSMHHTALCWRLRMPFLGFTK